MAARKLGNMAISTEDELRAHYGMPRRAEIQTPPEGPSQAWFLLFSRGLTDTEIGVNAHGLLCIRQTRHGQIVSQIPLGQADKETLELFGNRINQLARLLPDQKEPKP